MNKYSLEMVLRGPYGVVKVVVQNLDLDIAREIWDIPKPCPGLVTFDEGVATIKRRVFRKDLFMDAAHRLGMQLAENMEDAEGWHGEERREKMERIKNDR